MINTEYMTKLTAEINRLGTRLQTSPPTPPTTLVIWSKSGHRFTRQVQTCLKFW